MNIRHTIIQAGIIVFCAGSATAQSSSDAMTRANRMAYGSAMKCFVANGYASIQRTKAGDPTKAAAYDASARRSFDASYLLGEKLGLQDREISRDLDYSQASELPKMIQDGQYLASVAATCKAIGLM